MNNWLVPACGSNTGFQGNRMNAVCINSSPVKGRLGGGWGYLVAISSIKPPFAPDPHPIPPLEGEGAGVQAIAME